MVGGVVGMMLWVPAASGLGVAEDMSTSSSVFISESAPSLSKS